MLNTDVQSQMRRLDELLQETEQQSDPAAASRLQEVASLLLEMHGTALQKIFDHAQQQGEEGSKIIDAAANDPAVSPLLILHGLHPTSALQRVQGALEKVSPYVRSHGGHVHLVSLTDDGVLSLRLEGSCHGCPSSRVTLQTTIETEIYSAAPEVARIEVEGVIEEAPAAAGGFVPLEHVAIHGESIAQATAS